MQHVAPLLIDGNAKEVLECDLKAKFSARDLNMRARNICREKEDFVTMALFEKLLEDEEGHIDFF